MGKGLCSTFSYTLNSRCAAATQISVCNGLRCCSLPNPVCIQWKPPYQVFYLERVLIAKEKLQPSKTGCPEEEHVGVCLFVCFPIAVHCGYSTPKGSSGEVLKLGLNREMFVTLEAAVAVTKVRVTPHEYQK